MQPFCKGATCQVPQVQGVRCGGCRVVTYSSTFCRIGGSGVYRAYSPPYMPFAHRTEVLKNNPTTCNPATFTSILGAE